MCSSDLTISTNIIDISQCVHGFHFHSVCGVLFVTVRISPPDRPICLMSIIFVLIVLILYLLSSGGEMQFTHSKVLTHKKSRISM